MIKVAIWILTVDNDEEYTCEVFGSEADAHAYYFQHYGAEAYGARDPYPDSAEPRRRRQEAAAAADSADDEDWPTEADGFNALVEFHQDRSNDYGSFETNLTCKTIVIDPQTQAARPAPCARRSD